MKGLFKSILDRRIVRELRHSLAITREYTDVKTIAKLAEEVSRVAANRHFTEAQIYQLFYTINRRLYPKFVINDRGRLLLDDLEFRNYFERFSNENWTTFERRWNVREMLRLLADVDGDLAECGVYRGGTAFLMCRFAQQYGREVHLFDSFEGLSSPGDNDGAFWTQGDLNASEAIVCNNLKDFLCFRVFRGWIPDKFHEVSSHSYAFVHIDVDLEQPTYDSLAFFYPRLSTGGIIILDDHGYDTCPGARKAAQSYMLNKPEPVIELSTGQGLVIKK